MKSKKIPQLLDEVHRLIEEKKYKFILTGSSPRKLRRKAANLLGGRALRYEVYPLTALELGTDFDLQKALRYGLLPTLYDKKKTIDPEEYLEAYLNLYLHEEVYQEGLVRNLGFFSRFLEIASFSQGELLNVCEVAREAAVNRKVAEHYFDILEELLIGIRLSPFLKKAKRRLVKHRKFYFFDVGVYRTVRPKGAFEVSEEIDGHALETLVFQELRALTGNLRLPYEISFWRTTTGLEVDFILYGPKLLAIEVKRKKTIANKDLKALQAFKKDYPIAECYLFYGGERKIYFDEITAWPIAQALSDLAQFF